MELIDQNIANATRMRVYVLVTASRNVFTPCHISVFDICRIIEVMWASTPELDLEKTQQTYISASRNL